MSRLRRLVLSDRFFFITCRLQPGRRKLSDSAFACLARVIGERRRKHGFLLTAWVLLPDHWHAILFPRHPLSISVVMESIKVGSTLRLNAGSNETGSIWQPRFFDRALRTVSEYNRKVEYIHLNPVKSGLASRPQDWPWSSVHAYTGTINQAPLTPSGLSVDRVFLPADPPPRNKNFITTVAFGG